MKLFSTKEQLVMYANTVLLDKSPTIFLPNEDEEE